MRLSKYIFVPAIFICLLFANIAKCSASSYPLTDSLNERVDSIVIIKQQRKMSVYHNQKLLKEYHICLGSDPITHIHPLGPKRFEGDYKTPEGIYRIIEKKEKSDCYKSLRISYPSPSDKKYAQEHHKATGNDIMIHGFPPELPPEVPDKYKIHGPDWTAGCIAITNNEIDELFAHTNVCAYVNILPEK